MVDTSSELEIKALILREKYPYQLTLRKKCPYSELFWSAFPAFGVNAERCFVYIRPNVAKYGPE